MRTRFPVFDLHCDTAVELQARHQSLNANTLQNDLDRGDKLQHHVQVYSFCCVYDEKGGPLPQAEAERRFQDALLNFYAQLEANRDRVSLCRSAEDMLACANEGRRPVFLSLEGPEVIDCDPDRLEELKELGIVMTTLTWNHKNALAGSHLTGEGLTDRGKAFVRRAQELGILLDVSHLSERAFWDLCDLSLRPMVASHSNSRTVCDHSRNLTDKQFKTICNFGGLVGLNLYTPFLTRNKTSTFEDVKAHLEHFLALGGKHHLSLGGDLDGCDQLPKGFTGVDSYNALGRYLLEQGLEEQTVLRVMNNNAVRFFLQYLRRETVG